MPLAIMLSLGYVWIKNISARYPLENWNAQNQNSFSYFIDNLENCHQKKAAFYSCLLFNSSKVFPFLSFHSVHPLLALCRTNSDAAEGVGKGWSFKKIYLPPSFPNIPALIKLCIFSLCFGNLFSYPGKDLLAILEPLKTTNPLT